SSSIQKRQRIQDQQKISSNDGEVASNVDLSDFTGLDGEQRRFGRFSFPLSLIPTVERINSVYGDISATSLVSPSVSTTVYVLFCAVIRDMEHLRLEEVTEDIILKWRDVIKDALRLGFNVVFAMEHLKKVVFAYIGQRGCKLLHYIDSKISTLEAEVNDWKKKRTEIYEESKMCVNAAENFIGVPVSTDGSSSFFTSKKPVDGQWMELVGFVEDKAEISAINGGLAQSLTDQDQLNQLGTSEGSYQTKSEGGRPKLSLAQKRENKRLSDYRYRQKRKITADELSAENKHLKEENEGLIAENRLLKSKLELLLSYGDSKANAEPSSGSGKPMEQKAKQDYSNLGARRAQATDGHRAMREQISESTKILKDLIPACNKVQGALLLDEIFSYIQSLQQPSNRSVLSPGQTGILSSDSVESLSLRRGMQSRRSTFDQVVPNARATY
ncbi:hypothetical protein Goari_017513, partial [Gossypium aridum]|nr:hypothetical protein [Gossypium aridum]